MRSFDCFWDRYITVVAVFAFSAAFIGLLFVALPFIQSLAGYAIIVIMGFSGIFLCFLVEHLRRANIKAYLEKKQAETASLASANNEQFIKSIINSMPDMMGYWDRELFFRFANPSYIDWFGKSPEEIIGSSVRELMGEKLYAINKPHIAAAFAGEKQTFTRILIKPDGNKGYILGQYIPDINDQGDVVGIFILAVDITPLKQAEAQLELAASVFENTIEGITVTNADGVILSVNPAFTSITGYTAEEAIGNTPRILKSNRHDHAFYIDMWNQISANGQWKGEIWNRRKSGEVYLERITITMIRDSDGMPARYVSVFSDITDLWHKDEYLRHLAFHDALTHLPNRSLLMDRLNTQITNASREKTNLALMFLDLDGFKKINDQFGHDVGDDLLKVVAKRLLSVVRESDTVARLGGDEFVVKLTRPENREEVKHIAGRIVADINEPMEFRSQPLQIGISIGIAIYPEHGNTALELVKNADTAMYAAKDAGKNTFFFYEATMDCKPD
jgi:diguanylate cyclase (GGDEF)-like protein/PAS domain S-box-containing protein